MDKWNIAAWTVIMVCAITLYTYADSRPVQNEIYEIQQRLAEDIIRFHVRANSDTREDQELKLQVKEVVVSYLEELLDRAASIDEVRETITANIKDIENVAKGVILEAKKEYNIEAYFEETYFPIKSYGDITLPAGIYEAFRIDIGEAEGKNWWCVIYPKLCFVDVCYGVVPEESKNELAAVLDEDEFTLITQTVDKETASGKIVFEFKIFKFLNQFIK